MGKRLRVSACVRPCPPLPKGSDDADDDDAWRFFDFVIMQSVRRSRDFV